MLPHCLPCRVSRGAATFPHRLPLRSIPRSASASNIFPMVLCHGGASHKALCHGAPASNKPHSAEKSTPVWLAIWRIWVGFANSQLLRATFHSTYSYKCTSTLLPPCNRCSDMANLSAHLHRLPTPPPYLRQMRLLPGKGRKYWIANDDDAWSGRRYPVGDEAGAWPGAAFLQITARANPCSRHLWGTLARAVASI